MYIFLAKPVMPSLEEVAKDLVNVVARSSNAQQMTEIIGFPKQMYKNSAESLTL